MFDADGVIALRKRLGLTQKAFAAKLGVTVWSVRNWEQNVNTPGGAAATLMGHIQAELDAPARKSKGRRVQSPAQHSEEPSHAEATGE